MEALRPAIAEIVEDLVKGMGAKMEAAKVRLCGGPATGSCPSLSSIFVYVCAHGFCLLRGEVCVCAGVRSWGCYGACASVCTPPVRWGGDVRSRNMHFSSMHHA